MMNRSLFFSIIILTGALSFEPASGQDNVAADKLVFSKLDYGFKAEDDLTNFNIEQALKHYTSPKDDDWIVDRFSAELTIPVAQDDNGSANLLTNFGLERGYSGALKWRRTRWTEAAIPDNNAGKTRRERIADLEKKATHACLDRFSNASEETTEQACISMKRAQSIPYLKTKDREEFERLLQVDSSIFVYGATASLGFDTFDFIDPTSFAELDTTETNYSLDAFVGLRPNENPFFVAAGVQYKVEHEGGDEVIQCQDAANIPDSCVNDRFGPPVQNTDYSVLGLIRYQFDMGIPVAFEIKGTYDFEDDEVGISVPLYFLPNIDDGGLNGGVKISWENDDDDDVTFGFFFTTDFNIFGDP